MPESAAQISVRIAELAKTERILLVTPGRHGGEILRDLLANQLGSPGLKLTVFDADRKRLDAATSLRPKSAPATTFVLGRATRMPFTKHSFEVVLAFEALYAIRPPWTVIAELHRALVPDGKLILFEPAKHGIFSTLRDKCIGPGKRIFSTDEIKYRLGRADYTIEKLEQIAHVEGMAWPAYCVHAVKRENPVEPVPQFTTAREMIESRKKPPVGEELP